MNRFGTCGLILVLTPLAPAQEKPWTDRNPHGQLLPAGALATFGRMPFHNGARIQASELSPDGMRLATLSARSATVWDTATGQPLHRFFFPVQAWPGHDRILAFSPNGKWLAARPTADHIAVWDVTTGQEVKRFSVASTNYSFAFCRFSADNSALIVEEKDDVIWLSMRTGAIIRRLSGVRMNQLSPDDRMFAMVRKEQKQVLVGDAQTGKILHRLPVAAMADDRHRGILFLPDGITLAVVDNRTSRDDREVLKEVQFWDLRTGKRRADTWSLPRSDQNYDYRLALSPDGKVLYFPEDRKNIHRWSLTMRKELPPIGGGWIEALHPHPDGKTLFSVHLEVFRRWDHVTGNKFPRDKALVDWNETTTAISRDGRWLAVTGFQGPLLLWDAETRRGKRIDLGTSNGHNLAFSPDGKALAVNRYDHVRLLRVPELIESKKLRAKVGEGALQFSPDGRLLASLDTGLRLLRLFEATTGKEVGSVKDAFGALFAPDSKRLLVAPWRGELRLHDVATQRVHWQTKVPHDRVSSMGARSSDAPPCWVTALAFSPDGRVLAVALSGGHVCLLDAATGKERARFLSMPSDERQDRYLHATALAFSANGHWLAVGGEDGFLRIWEVRTCREVHRLHGHEEAVAALAFSADGRRLLSFGAGEGFLWDLQPK